MNITPKNVVDRMMSKDAFSRWMGVEVLEVMEGYSRIRMTVRQEMTNGFGIVHGGILFGLADSVFAFACNSRNNLSLAMDNSMNFLKPSLPGDVLTAEAKELHNGRSTGLYYITITNQDNKIIGVFKGNCFRTGKPVVG